MITKSPRSWSLTLKCRIPHLLINYMCRFGWKPKFTRVQHLCFLRVWTSSFKPCCFFVPEIQRGGGDWFGCKGQPSYSHRHWLLYQRCESTSIVPQTILNFDLSSKGNSLQSKRVVTWYSSCRVTNFTSVVCIQQLSSYTSWRENCYPIIHGFGLVCEVPIGEVNKQNAGT